ncbi:uncharacterized protein LOC126581628 [Anopheles aquasalis]|uniref:uncharacterized protein LOC126581628 n=1 Tax=Anopheles aquasalis TaxID=42839 RepID=UPI00215B42D4|nr:uncharacterized protein LOC126581628 [Anopheles aquasalis]
MTVRTESTTFHDVRSTIGNRNRNESTKRIHHVPFANETQRFSLVVSRQHRTRCGACTSPSRWEVLCCIKWNIADPTEKLPSSWAIHRIRSSTPSTAKILPSQCTDIMRLVANYSKDDRWLIDRDACGQRNAKRASSIEGQG